MEAGRGTARKCFAACSGKVVRLQGTEVAHDEVVGLSR
jgi:hypothetical protein